MKTNVTDIWQRKYSKLSKNNTAPSGLFRNINLLRLFFSQ